MITAGESWDERMIHSRRLIRRERAVTGIRTRNDGKPALPDTGSAGKHRACYRYIQLAKSRKMIDKNDPLRSERRQNHEAEKGVKEGSERA